MADEPETPAAPPAPEPAMAQTTVPAGDDDDDGGAPKSSVLDKLVDKPDVRDVATAAKLKTLLDGFRPFDEAMRLETRLRREKDARKVSAMKAEMKRLEGLLKEQNVAAARENRDLQRHCDAELEAARVAFGELLEAQDAKVHERIATLEKRADDLDALFAREKARIMAEIEERSATLSKMLDEFQEAFEKERQARLARENTVGAQMDQHEKHASQHFKAEQTARLERVKEVQDELAACVASRTTADLQLERVCAEEIAKIQDAIDLEVAQRELQDDNIIKALSQYTDKMQSSLSIINSTNA